MLSSMLVAGAIAAGAAGLAPLAAPPDRAATVADASPDTAELISRRYRPSSASRGTGRREIMTHDATDMVGIA